MHIPRTLPLLAALAPLACASPSPPVPVAPSPSASTAPAASTTASPTANPTASVPEPPGCEGLVKPLRALVGLSENAKLARMGDLKPAHPEQMASELDADAA